ncbi:MAG: C45 family autoproteolytic acyltransferase/hydrolase [Dehalococcoidia bacterium]|nr:C45 family autoproteolytic acyltransferase/hydrolase [Dehalococcoidia bacterium]
MRGGAATAVTEAGRRDVGDLIYDMHRSDWSALIGGFGGLARAADAFLPRFWMAAGPRYDNSGFYKEIRGIADGLRVSRAAAWRGVFGSLGGGTTTLVATRTATADGSAIMAKNSDWPDRNGRRPPMVTHYQPSNGDLHHVVAGWPLTPLGAGGLNQAGLALGLNFFNADQVLALGRPRWPYRRVLQRATTVEEGVRIIVESPNRGISGFVSLADAKGDIAIVECTPGDCEVFRPDGDWFAQSNHARTPKMIAHDRGRSLDSFTRRPAMEAAVTARLGRITPEAASVILRDRSNSKYVNESVVANAAVFHSVVMHPASRTLWHSTARQPVAPFGKLAPFSPDANGAGAPELPADPLFGSPGMQHEAGVIAEVRRAMRLFDEGDVAAASAIWERFAETGEPLLQPHRLTWARARARWTLGRLEEAEGLLAGLDADAVPFDVRINAVIARAVVADRLGDRPRAVDLYRRGQELFGENRQYNDGLVAPLHKRIAAGLRAPLTRGPFPPTPALQRVPS